MNVRQVAALGVEKMGFITKDGKVFSIDELVKTPHGNNTDIVLLARTDRKTKANMQVSQDGGLNSDDVICLLPDNTDDLGVFAHEVGHSIRSREVRDDNEKKQVYSEAHREFIKPADNKLNPGQIATNVTGTEARQIEAAEERGAWATGFSIFREVGKNY